MIAAKDKVEKRGVMRRREPEHGHAAGPANSLTWIIDTDTITHMCKKNRTEHPDEGQALGAQPSGLYGRNSYLWRTRFWP